MKGKVETGPYKAGIKLLNLPEGNICYVYYPVDKETKGISDEFPYRLSTDTEDLSERQAIISWISGGKYPPQFLMRPEFQTTIPVAVQAVIAKDFQDNKRPLVPLIFSHGMMSNSNINSLLLRELASYGILIVSISHHDGSNAGTRDHRTWNRVKFDLSKPLNDIERRREQLDFRVEEIKSVISELKKEKLFKNVKIDFSKLVLAGFSFGGLTALRACKEIKAKACISLDPWYFPVYKEIMAGDFKLNADDPPTLIIRTPHFPAQVDGYTKCKECSQAACGQAFLDNSVKNKGKIERVLIENATHDCLCDD